MPFGADRRLRKHAEFARAQGDRTTRRVGTAHFTLLVAAQREPGPSRLGLVVGRRIGGAVQRNRVKRLCRECFRTQPTLVPSGVDLIVIARQGAPELDLARVRAEWLGVQRLLQKRAAEALARGSSPHHPPDTQTRARSDRP
jgi:ribonuclease P protein component